MGSRMLFFPLSPHRSPLLAGVLCFQLYLAAAGHTFSLATQVQFFLEIHKKSVDRWTCDKTRDFLSLHSEGDILQQLEIQTHNDNVCAGISAGPPHYR